MKKMPINGKLCDVISMEEYTENPDLFNPKFTAIEIGHAGVVLPLKNKNDVGVGIYYKKDSMAAMVIKPEPDDTKYSMEHVIDYSKSTHIGDIISKDNLVRDIESDILTTKDNIFELNIGSDDSPEMVAIKQAVNLKQVDIRQYESRFTQFQNDIRLLKGKSITLGKLISTCDNFDIIAELILKDKKDCPNPMNSEIHIDLTGGE